MADAAGPVRQQLEFLLNGFSFYARREQVRADDLLVRGRAAAALGRAGSALRDLASRYRRRFLPDPTRDDPTPPTGAMQGLRAIEGLHQDVGDAEARLRGQGFPASDRTWARLRSEHVALELALAFDRRLIAEADEVEERCRALRPEDLGGEPGIEPAGLVPARQSLDALLRTLRERTAHLSIPD